MRFFVSLVIGLGLFCSSGFAQSNIDSLKAVLQKLPQDSNYVKTLHEVSLSFIGSYPDSIIHYSQQCLDLSQKIGFESGMARAQQLLGIAMYQKGEADDAIAYYYEALKYFEKKKLSLNAGKTYNNIGLIYAQQGEQDRALASYLKSLGYLELTPDQVTLARVTLNVGNTYVNKQKLDSALIYHFKALDIAKKINDENTIALILINIGSVYGRKNDLDKALHYFEEALPLTQKPGDIQNEAYALESIATLYEAKGDYKKAAEIAETAFKKMRKADHKLYLSNISQKLYTIYAKNRQFEKALFYHERFKEISDSLKNDAQSLELIRLENKFQFEQKEEALQLAQMEENLKNEKKINQQRSFLYLLIGVVLLIFIIFGFYYNYQKQKIKSHRLLEQKHKEIEQQAAELAVLNNLKDKLFTIIGHDLRSPLASLQQVLELVNQGELSEKELQTLLKQLAKDVSQGSIFLDNLLQWAKSQIKGERINLSEITLQPLCAQVSNNLEFQLAEKDIALDMQIEAELKIYADGYMIEIVLRNLLLNAIKFSKPKGTIHLAATKAGSQVIISVTDDGVGIKAENLHRLFANEYFTTKGTAQERGTGLGLMLCKEFIEKNNGQISVESIEGQGSKFSFTLPVA